MKKRDDAKWPLPRGTHVRVESVPGDVWTGVVVDFVRGHLHIQCPDGRVRAAWARWCRRVE